VFGGCRSCREAAERGQEPPPEPDFKITIPRQPHWTIVRIQRGVHSLLQLIGEGVAQHRVVSIMSMRPQHMHLPMHMQTPGFGIFAGAGGPMSTGGGGADDAGDSDPASQASARCALLEACLNSITEGFLA
jgi:hypothetical protein